MKYILIAGFGIILLITSYSYGATFRLSKVYSSYMVLQMAPKSANIWGFGIRGANVTVTIDNSSYLTNVKDDETWNIRLPPYAQGGPYTIIFKQQTINITKHLQLNNVLFGDVWLCAGEENMELFMKQIHNGTDEMLMSVKHPQLRLMHIGHQAMDVPQLEPPVMESSWARMNKTRLEWFSATCYLFAKELSLLLNERPIGIIEVAWTSTGIQGFLSGSSIVDCQIPWTDNDNGNSNNSAFRNTAMQPLFPVAIRGAIWNHGETALNEFTMEQFACATSELVNDWRTNFVDADVPVPAENNVAFPFGIIQIGADSNENSTNKWLDTRLYQSALFDQYHYPHLGIKDSFQVVTYDLPEFNHSGMYSTMMYRDKHTVVFRLVNALQDLLYGNSSTSIDQAPMILADVLTYDSVSSVAFLSFDMDVVFNNTSGLAFKTQTGNWTETPIISFSGRTFSVKIPAEARYLSYAGAAMPCPYLQPSIFASKEPQLPANPFIIPWPPRSSSHKLKMSSFLLIATLILTKITKIFNVCT